MVIRACNPSYLGGWGRKFAWTRESEVAVSPDRTIVLQPGDRVRLHLKNKKQKTSAGPERHMGIWFPLHFLWIVFSQKLMFLKSIFPRAAHLFQKGSWEKKGVLSKGTYSLCCSYLGFLWFMVISSLLSIHTINACISPWQAGCQSLLKYVRYSHENFLKQIKPH